MKKYRAYLFDFDYTLVNSERGIVDCFQHAFHINGYDNIRDEDIKATIGYHLRDAFPMLLPGIKADFVEKLRNDFGDIADKIMTKETELFPDSAFVLEQIKKQGSEAAIVSTKKRVRIEEGIVKFGISDLISFVIGDEDVEKPKPDPEGILKAAKQLRVSTEELLYIGDTVLDAQAAVNAGTDFAGVTTGTTTAAELAAYPNVRIASSLKELLWDPTKKNLL